MIFKFTFFKFTKKTIVFLKKVIIFAIICLFVISNFGVFNAYHADAASITQTTDTDFGGGTNLQTVVSGAGNTASVELATTNWYTPTIDSEGDVGGYPSIALGPDGFPRISYSDYTNYTLKFVQCTDAACSTKNITTVDNTAWVGEWTSLAIGSDGFARISYYDYQNRDLKFVQCTNVACSTKNITTIDSTGTVGSSTSLALGSDGFARISYRNGTSLDLKFVQCTNDACTTKSITSPDTTGSVGSHTSLAIGSDGFARISYYDSDNSALKFLRCANANCSSLGARTIVDSGGVGHFSSLALGSDGFARISYSALTNNDLKFLQCTNDNCSTKNITTVDSAGAVGWGTSLDLGSDGFARISYLDHGNYNLKFVQCADATCSTKSVSIIDSVMPGLGTIDNYSRTSLVLGSGDSPKIAFYENTDKDLKFAYPGASHYRSSGTFTSSIMDANEAVNLNTLAYNKTAPTGTSFSVDARAGNTAIPDGTWTSWLTDVSSGGDISSLGINRYIQYRANLGASDTSVTPSLSDITINYSTSPLLSEANSIISVSSATVGSPVTITVTAYDTDGNVYTTGGDTVVVSVSGSNSATPVVTDNGDGTYTTTYTPITVGADQVTATLNGTAVGKDADGTSDGTYNLTVTAAPVNDEDDEEDEEEKHLTLDESKDSTLTLDTYIPKGKNKVMHISSEDDQATQIKEIEIEADDKHKVDGEIEIKKIKKTEIPALPEEISNSVCSVYTQVKVDADSSIDSEDIQSAIFHFRINKKYKKNHSKSNFSVVHKKGDKVKLLKLKSNQANEITAISSNLEGTWTVLDCIPNPIQETETEKESLPSESITSDLTPENPTTNPSLIPETPTTPEPQVLESIQLDIDGDKNLEEAADADNSSANGRETFQDPDDSSNLVVTIDGDFDGYYDFILDTDGDFQPDTYWDPDSGIVSRVEMIDIDNDSVKEYIFGAEAYYDPSDRKVKLIKQSLIDQAREFLEKHKIEAASIVVASAALPLVALPFEVSSLSSAWLVVKESLLRLFGFFFWRRKKFRDWGTVYDVDSGRPIPLAVVKIIDKETGLSKETKITDSLGSYYFLVSPGTYALDPEKKEFSEFTNNDLSAFPVWTEKTYQYQPLEFKEYAKVDADIPMKLVDGNFSPLPKKGFWKFMFGIIFWTGLFLNLAIFAITPSVFNALMIFVYLVLEVIRRFGKGRSKWGIVTNAEGVPQSFVTLKLYKEENRELVARTITDEKGRYFLIANPGNYILTAETIGGKKDEAKLSLKSRSSVKKKIKV